MLAGQVPGPREGPSECRWLCIGWESNVSQQEMRVVLKIQRGTDIDRVSRRLRKERNTSLVFVQGLGFFFTEVSDLVYMPSEASRT